MIFRSKKWYFWSKKCTVTRRNIWKPLRQPKKRLQNNKIFVGGRCNYGKWYQEGTFLHPQTNEKSCIARRCKINNVKMSQKNLLAEQSDTLSDQSDARDVVALRRLPCIPRFVECRRADSVTNFRPTKRFRNLTCPGGLPKEAGVGGLVICERINHITVQSKCPV